jgi:hypothetical protein
MFSVRILSGTYSVLKFMLVSFKIMLGHNRFLPLPFQFIIHSRTVIDLSVFPVFVSDPAWANAQILVQVHGIYILSNFWTSLSDERTCLTYFRNILGSNLVRGAQYAKVYVGFLQDCRQMVV